MFRKAPAHPEPADAVRRPNPDATADGGMTHTPPSYVAPPENPALAEGTGGMQGLPASPPIDRGRGGKRPKPAGAH
jgi:hypothetical protein